MFDVTDGQHRIAAIAGSSATKPVLPSLLTEAPQFEADSMSVLIVVEEEIARIHQDFADAAQTKQIPASLLAAFNTREPVNKVLSRIVDRSEFFKGRVDETSKTLAKLSQSVFLLNNLRAFVKELLVGDYAIAEDALGRYTEKLLSTTEQQDLFVNRALQLIDVLTAKMEPWNEIVKISVDDTMASRIPDLRKKYISLTATGLVIIGRVAFEINKWLPESERLSKYIELATNVDWKREADIWHGSILLESGKILTNRAPVALAAERVKGVLDLKELHATAATA